MSKTPTLAHTCFRVASQLLAVLTVLGMPFVPAIVMAGSSDGRVPPLAAVLVAAPSGAILFAVLAMLTGSRNER